MATPRPGTLADRAPAGRLDALDGIRTIAVFLVVLFHVATPGLQAGFIGVDVFFVLSGYLITSGLAREVRRSGRIDLVKFWTRRLRRLMPAAMLVLAVVLVWSWFWAPVYRRPALGGDLFWTVVYLGNWHFMQAGSYFNADGTQSPLLHMWSLAVEEQFYLGWPLLLGLVGFGVAVAAHWRGVRRGARRAITTRREHTLAAAIVLGLVILVGSVVLLAVLHNPNTPDRAYMGTDSKAFEPMLGALLALLLTRGGAERLVTTHARTLGWAGAVVMAGLFWFMSGPSAFYFRGGALLFCLGTAGVLLAGVHAPDWIGSRVLAWGPMAYLGRISYGIYLWHWPLAVWLDTHASFRPWRAVVVVVATVALASASYHLVETPIRAGQLTSWLSAPRTFACAAALMAIVLVVTAPLGGTPLSPLASRILPRPALNDSAILMVGDSVPQRIMPVLAPEGSKRGLVIAATTAGGCSPLGVHQRISDDDMSGPTCPSIRTKQTVGLDNINPGTVVWWSRYEIADRYQGDQLLIAGTGPFWQAQLADFRQAVDRLTAHGAVLVVVLTESPGIGMKTRCSPGSCHPFLQRMVTRDGLRQHWNDLVVAEARTDKRIRAISLNDVLCNKPATWNSQQWGSSLCDDTVSTGHLGRPDGSHVDNGLVGVTVSDALIERVLSATGH